MNCVCKMQIIRLLYFFILNDERKSKMLKTIILYRMGENICRSGCVHSTWSAYRFLRIVSAGTLVTKDVQKESIVWGTIEDY